MSDDEDPLRKRYNLQNSREQMDNSRDMKVKDEYIFLIDFILYLCRSG
jgi:hypothetical protein